MFTDIVDSTRLVEMLGDEQWESLLAWHDRTLRACFEARAGEEVKHEGDGFFVAFAEPGSALECACSIQRTLRDHTTRSWVRATRSHRYPCRGSDRSRRRLHRPRSPRNRRITAAASAGEIIASRTTLEAAGNAFRVLNERSLELKGLAEPVKVATVDWSDG